MPAIHTFDRQDGFLERLVFEWVEASALGDEDQALVGTGVMFGGHEAVRWDDPRFEAEGALLFRVAGTSFRPGALDGPGSEVGARVRLVPEPENPYDPDAIAVYGSAGERQIGYVPRERTGVVARLARGEHGAVIFYEWRLATGERSGVRVVLGPPRFVGRLERFIASVRGTRR